MSNQISLQLVHTDQSLELLVMELSCPNLLICSVYIPPSSSESAYKNHFSHLHSLPQQPTIVVRDFNLPDVNCSTLTASSPLFSAFSNIFYSLNLTQMIEVQTHKSGSILDLVLAKLPNLIANVTVQHMSTTSDHHLVSFSMICNSQSYQPKPRHIWNYSKADLTSLHNGQRLLWHTSFNGT